MQSIIDKLQTPQSFAQSVNELVIALQRTGDPGNLSRLRPHFDLLANVDPSADAGIPAWSEIEFTMTAVKTVVEGLVEFVQSHSLKRIGLSSGGGSSPLTTCTNSLTDSVIQGLTGLGGGGPDYHGRNVIPNRYKTSLCRDWAQRGQF